MTKVDQELAKNLVAKGTRLKDFKTTLKNKFGTQSEYATTLYYKLKKEIKTGAKSATSLSSRSASPKVSPNVGRADQPTDTNIGKGAVESDVQTKEGEELKSDAANINKGFKGMLEDFEDVEDVETEEEQEEGEEPEGPVGTGAAPPASVTQIETPYKFWFNLTKGFEDFMYKERPLTTDDFKPIEQTSDAFQAHYLAFISTDPNAIAWNYVLAAGLIPMIPRLDLVGTRIVEFFNWIRVMSGKAPLKMTPYGLVEDKSKAPPPKQESPKPETTKMPLSTTQSGQPNEIITPTTATVPTGERVAPDGTVYEGTFDPTVGIDYDYYKATGRIRNKRY